MTDSPYAPIPRPFPSVERLLIDYIRDHTGVHALAELPHAFDVEGGPTEILPVIAVERISGGDQNYKLDLATVDVDCYGPDRATAQDLAEQVRNLVRFSLPGATVGGAVFTRTRTIVGPRLLPHANPGVRRYSGTYEFLLHTAP